MLLILLLILVGVGLIIFAATRKGSTDSSEDAMLQLAYQDMFSNPKVKEGKRVVVCYFHSEAGSIHGGLYDRGVSEYSGQL